MSRRKKNNIVNPIDFNNWYDIISSRKQVWIFPDLCHLFAMQSFLTVWLILCPNKGGFMKKDTFMKEKPVFPLIISMALPMIISMCVNSLYNIVDSYFVAKISEDAMTSLSLVYPVQNFVNAVAIGFGVGINAVIAFYLGAGDKNKADSAATQGFLLSIIHGVVLTATCIFVMKPFLLAFTKDGNVISLGVQYCNIVFLFTVINSLNLFFEKLFQAEGNMKITMIGLMVGCITNIILDPVMIFGLAFFPKMGIKGAALATALGQCVTFLIYIIYYFAKPGSVRVNKKYFKLTSYIVKKLYSIGIPAILNLALPSILISSLNAILATFSQVYVLVLGVYYKLQTFLYLTANGIIQGMRPIIAYNYGAGEYKRVRKIYNYVLIMIAIIMAVGMVICLTVPSNIISMFTSNSETVKLGATALRIISAGFVFSAVSVTSCGALEGLSKGFPSLVISLCRYIVIIIPSAFVLSKFFGAIGVWHAFWVAELLTAIISIFVYKKSVKFNKN